MLHALDRPRSLLVSRVTAPLTPQLSPSHHSDLDNHCVISRIRRGSRRGLRGEGRRINHSVALSH